VVTLVFPTTDCINCGGQRAKLEQAYNTVLPSIETTLNKTVNDDDNVNKGNHLENFSN
jgi:hypothetical protein